VRFKQKRRQKPNAVTSGSRGQVDYDANGVPEEAQWRTSQDFNRAKYNGRESDTSL
jgi:hypothetical protein